MTKTTIRDYATKVQKTKQPEIILHKLQDLGLRYDSVDDEISKKDQEKLEQFLASSKPEAINVREQKTHTLRGGITVKSTKTKRMVRRAKDTEVQDSKSIDILETSGDNIGADAAKPTELPSKKFVPVVPVDENKVENTADNHNYKEPDFSFSQDSEKTVTYEHKVLSHKPIKTQTTKVGDKSKTFNAVSVNSLVVNSNNTTHSTEKYQEASRSSNSGNIFATTDTQTNTVPHMSVSVRKREVDTSKEEKTSKYKKPINKANIQQTGSKSYNKNKDTRDVVRNNSSTDKLIVKPKENSVANTSNIRSIEPKNKFVDAKPAGDANRGNSKLKSKSLSQDNDKYVAHKQATKDSKHRLSANQFAGYLDGDDSDDYGFGSRGGARRKKHKPNKHAFVEPTQPIKHTVNIGETITVAELAGQMAVKSADVIKFMFSMGSMVTLNQSLDSDTAQLIVEEFGHEFKIVNDNVLEEELKKSLEHDGAQVSRAPVVTVMGHVDHGKTSLLDYIRRAKIADYEAGGITQHIGAYHVETERGMITFLDTPGHAAFTAMRARGVKATDIVILVVAADDGVMPQTIEAVQHAKAAGVPIVVAVNKVDKPNANPDNIKQALAALEVVPEEWGGDSQFVHVSAKVGTGIDELLEAVLLQAEVLELSANPHALGRGVVVESKLDKGRGPVATILIQNGTLKQGDMALVGTNYGRIRVMYDENGNIIKEAGPSIPVEILGLDGVPNAGDDLTVTHNERKAREIAIFRQDKERKIKMSIQTKSMESMFSEIGDGVKTLNVVLKTDVRGSLEALTSSILQLGNEEVQVKVVSGGVGGINESDANLALASNAILVGFNVRADAVARKIAESENLNLKYYSVIYDIIEDVKIILSGLLSVETRENILGVAQVRDVFRSPKFGAIAGCMVIEGIVYRNRPIRVLREDVVIYEGELESLRRFKDDVGEVRNNMECGIGVKNYNDVKIGDMIEVFERVEVARSL